MLKDLANALPELVGSLRRGEMAIGTDQYLNALDLLTHFYVSPQSPTRDQLRAGLCGIFCTNPDEQARFGLLFGEWIAVVAHDEPESVSEEIAVAPPLTWPQRFKTSPFTIALPWLVAFALTALLAVIISLPEQSVDVPPLDQTSRDIETPIEPEVITPVNEFLPPPRLPLATPSPTPAFYPWWAGALRLLWLPLVFLWLGWMLWLIGRRFMVLRRDKLAEDDPVTLANLTLTPQCLQLFNDPGLEPFWRSLRRFHSRKSTRLDVNATVNQLLRNGGYFEPFYRQRAVPPAYLVLTDRRHSQDHAAGFALDFVAAMRRENLQVVDLHYRFDPRFSRAPGHSGHSHGPSGLINLYPDHDLILSGEGEALADPAGSDLSHWTQIFTWWPRKWLLSPAPLWPRMAFFRRLADADFRAAALSTEGLRQLHDSRVELAQDNPLDLPVPAILARDPLYWVQEQGISRKQAQAAIGELPGYLGRDGFLLLAATASYPELRWQLTRALDLQLKLDPATREWRLRKLSRLPWFRHAYLPDMVRYAIFARVPKADIGRLSDAYQALFENTGEQPLQLPVVVPDWEKRKGDVAQATQLATPGEPLSDPVLAAVIRGRRPLQLEFSLPFNWLNRRVAQDWRALWLPLLIGTLLMPAALWINLWFWQTQAESWVQDSALIRMRTASASSSVVIRHLAQTEIYARNMAAEFTNRGFSQVVLEALPAPQTQAADQTETNLLEYGSVDPHIVGNVRAGYDFITYGAELEQRANAPLAPGRIRLSLRSIPKVFQDPLVGLGPAMVDIPGGCFTMGSPEDEPQRSADETQHQVCVDDFSMGRYEVTFAEYNAFAVAMKREMPDDAGWGRSRRPVINVSWDDANDYALWLSEQTGKRYRLPSEAQWEYAARAGTRTPFSFGDTINPGQANYNGASYNGSVTGEYRRQTVAVGQFPGNAFGLYDMHGNVWEWTCSIYEADYNGEEARCGDGDNYDERAVRGGSWSDSPWVLRSNFRGNFERSERYSVIGFRLSRAHP